MPSLLDSQFPPPKSWESFEILCHDLWREKWQDPGTLRHGRQGQPQAGVDIYGQGPDGLTGIQCKLKSQLAGAQLSRAEIETEVKNARSFSPPLKRFIIATTAQRDTKVQQAAREISAEEVANGRFAVDVVAWEDIEADLAGYPDLIKKHYPDFLRLSGEGGKQPESLRSVAPAKTIRFWLDRVVEDHNQPVEFLTEWAGLDLLEHIYVQLALQTPEIGRETHRSKRPPIHEPMSIEQLLRLDPSEHSWITGRWVVKGDPGAGKTTLLRHLAATLAAQKTPAWIPIFASLPQVLADGRSLFERIADRLKLTGHAPEPVLKALHERGKQGQLLLLLDGLDEVVEPRRPDAQELLRGLAAKWKKCPVVVSSRPIGYRRPSPAFLEVQVLPFDRPRRETLLQRWFSHLTPEEAKEKAPALLRLLENDRGLWELSGNPLYLTLIALLFKEDEAPAANRRKLYDQIFQFLFEGKHKAEPIAIDNQTGTRSALAYLAYTFTQDDRLSEPLEALEDRLFEPEAEGVLRKLGRHRAWRDKPRVFLRDVASRTSILAPHDGRDANWRFWHRTFREAWASDALAERWHRGGEEAILAEAKAIEGDLSRWAEPYALLAGRVEDPDALVKALVGANRELGLRALATAQGLREETVAEVLELTDQWEERSEVYPKIPELVGDGERALQLLDRLRCTTRNGNDLFFLDLAVLEVAKRFPEHLRAAEGLRERLLDHIPAPADEDLFRWVDTPKDGRVELWRPVPKGKFWMGRSEGERGDDDELPRHEVTFTAGFQVGVVPVTNVQFWAFDPGHRWETWEGVSEDELAHYPVVNITWYQAMSFCRWLSATFPELRDARLPTEEEWEYACRAGTETAYWKGNGEEALAKVGWYDGTSGGRTHRVGELEANSWGLYDVHGNVWEWSLDKWDFERNQGRENGIRCTPSAIDADDYADASGVLRVVRGGSFGDGAGGARAAYRDYGGPGVEGRILGFRVVVPGPPEPVEP